MKSLKSVLIVLSILMSTPLFANTTLNLTVSGMHCGGCETKFKTAATGIKGIIGVTSVSAANGNAVIVYDEKQITPEGAVKELADRSGFTVSANTGAALTSATGVPAACCIKGQSNPSCTQKEKAKCAKKKCGKPANQ